MRFLHLGGGVALVGLLVGACSNAASDCDALGTCNPPPLLASGGGATVGPTSTTTGTGGGVTSSGVGASGVGGMLPASCNDGTQNGDESDVDCGGSCDACPNGAGCGDRADCASNRCDGSQCAACTMGDCEAGLFCAGGECIGLLPDGTPCGGDGSTCASGHCVDGVCCDTACDAICVQCALAPNVGTCSFTPFGQEEEGECQGGNSECDGAGQCD